MDSRIPNELYERLSEIFYGDSILKDEPMSRHTSFKIGGKVDIMVLPKNSDEILKAVNLANSFEIPYYVIGNGSNILVKDDGIFGVVIKISGKISNIKADGDEIYAEAGAKLSSIAALALENSLAGFGFAHGIPGTLGGAVIMNAGAYGSEIKDVLVYADVLNDKGKIIRFENSECGFGYRTSVFSQNKYIILGAKLKLKSGNADEIRAEMDRLKRLRQDKQPLDKPSAGSTFKRPKDNFAGTLIEQAGLKGFRYKNAMVSDKHAGFVVNCGGATADEVIKVIDTVLDTVNEKFGIILEPEVKIIP